MTMTTDDQPDPDLPAVELLAPGDIIKRHLTGAEALDFLVAQLKAARFVFQPEDHMVIEDARTLVTDKCQTVEDYERGFKILGEVGDLEKRIEAHYEPFKGPLNTLVGTVRALIHEDVDPISMDKGKLGLKQLLSRDLGRWKSEKDAADREAARQVQAALDAAAQAAQQTRADTLTRVAENEPDPAVSAMFHREAAQVASVHVTAAPVAVQQTAPKVADGHTRVDWSAKIVDVKALLRAWLAGQCFLDETAIIAGLQPQLNSQATSLRENLGRAYPGVVGVSTPRGVAAPRRGVPRRQS